MVVVYAIRFLHPTSNIGKQKWSGIANATETLITFSATRAGAFSAFGSILSILRAE
jgi:hypothetical protein